MSTRSNRSRSGEDVVGSRQQIVMFTGGVEIGTPDLPREVERVGEGFRWPYRGQEEDVEL